jgi:hypothetical protein
MVPDVEREWIAEEMRKPVRIRLSAVLVLGFLGAVVLWGCGGC